MPQKIQPISKAVVSRPVQNAAARVIFQIAKFDHITPALINLHWLPVTFRVQFKLLLFVYKSLHNQSPSYITDLLSVKLAANYALRSSGKSLLLVPKVNCSTLGVRAFAPAAPVLWNSLPLTISQVAASPFLKSNLKHFFLRKLLICWNSMFNFNLGFFRNLINYRLT